MTYEIGDTVTHPGTGRKCIVRKIIGDVLHIRYADKTGGSFKITSGSINTPKKPSISKTHLIIGIVILTYIIYKKYV